MAQSTIAAEALREKSNTSITPEKIFTEEKQFDAWQLKCLNGKNKQERCSIVQRVTGKQGKARVLLINIKFPFKSDTPVLSFYLPLGISLIPGINYEIDSGPGKKLPVRMCTESGCIVRMNLDNNTIAELQRGKDLKVTFFIGNNRKAIVVDVSLLGFTKAFVALKNKNK